MGVRLVVVVEGATEQEFVNGVLAPHLGAFGVDARASVVGKVGALRRGGGHRGGGPFARWERDIRQILGDGQDGGLRVSTLFDLYGLPKDFPGLVELQCEADGGRRCDGAEAALARVFSDRRLIPYVQKHEFESLVLASLPQLRSLLDAGDDLAGLEALEAEIRGIAAEDVDEGPESAPSKRLLRHVPGYRKTLHGPMVVGATGLPALRERCPRFDGWVRRLEGLVEG